MRADEVYINDPCIEIGHGEREMRARASVLCWTNGDGILIMNARIEGRCVVVERRMRI